MTIDEQQRFEMHVGLRHALGDDVAATLMEHLPPSGWSDVARTRDIEHLRDHFDSSIATMQTRIDAQFSRIDERFARIDERFAHFAEQVDSRFTRIDERFAHFAEQIDRRFNQVDDRFAQIDRRLDSIVKGLWASGTVFAGAFVGLFSLIATKL